MKANQYQKYDSNAMSGYASMLLVRNTTGDIAGKYSLLLPLETVPSIFGSVDTFDFDLLTSPTKGRVSGKESLDDADVEFLWTRDNVARLEDLEGQVLDFLVVYQDFTGRGFSGTIKVRPNEAGADVMRGTFTITPMSAQTTTLPDCRDLIADTVTFATQTPSVMYVNTTGEKIRVALSESTGTIEAESNNEKFTVTATSVSNGSYDVEIKAVGATATDFGIITLKASATDCAGWTRTIAVGFKA